MTHNTAHIEDSIDRAAERLGSVWPLHSFVTANPLSGFEEQPFQRAVSEARELFGGRGYPRTSVFRQAWNDDRIDSDVLASECAAHGVSCDPEALLNEMVTAESTIQRETDDLGEELDRVLSKWLAAFLDQGQAGWPMPNREQGFYQAWRQLAPYDEAVPGCDDPSDLPDSPMDALESILSPFPQNRWETIFEHHLAALPGWTGFIKQQTSGDADSWQTAAPITLTDYLAVRLILADLLDATIDSDAAVDSGAAGDSDAAVDSGAAGDPDAAVDSGAAGDSDEVPLAEIWLRAWEKSYRNRLLDRLDRPESGSCETAQSANPSAEESRPAAQLVFCIDTRSEIIRRHVEAAGDYETAGYAGFFGIPMRYRPYGADVDVDACPPIVDPQHRVVDRPDPEQQAELERHDRWKTLVTAAREHLKTLKTNVAAAFPFVEGAGGVYGAAMAARTLFPARVHDAIDAVSDRLPAPSAVCTPALDSLATDGSHAPQDHGAPERGLSTEQKAQYAQTAFELMGWTDFARLVVFTGHASETANNPFDSSLDCGACAGNPGGPNARVLASICNEESVRSLLAARGIDIPSETVFVAAEHNTTTDEITLFDEAVPESHEHDLQRLREDLAAARIGATAERAESLPTAGSDPVRETERRATDWAETRPEWGLAGNAAFVIGPRELTGAQNLDGRAFLHSYDWETDPEGEALEAIMNGPLVVTQWINNQYYFATVDNGVYGGGSKTTQNPVGNVGVVQGNGGDLMTGLPIQSVSVDHQRLRHQPIRLTVVIHAPVGTVTDLLRTNGEIAELFDNGWMQLTVLDPAREETFHYQGELNWDPASERVPVHQ